jgi:transcriptional regulator with XRE-family HTH domain
MRMVKTKLSEINISQVARDTKINRTYVGRILGGKRVPSLPIAVRLAKSLGMSLDEFVKKFIKLN